MSHNYQVPGAEPRRFAFPFAAVPKGARVLIYGGGVVGKTYVQEVGQFDYCQLIAVADRHPQLVRLDSVKIISSKHILLEDFDYLLIALERQDLAVEVWRNLFNIGVPRKKIRWIDPRR